MRLLQRSVRTWRWETQPLRSACMQKLFYFIVHGNRRNRPTGGFTICARGRRAAGPRRKPETRAGARTRGERALRRRRAFEREARAWERRRARKRERKTGARDAGAIGDVRRRRGPNREARLPFATHPCTRRIPSSPFPCAFRESRATFLDAYRDMRLLPSHAWTYSSRITPHSRSTMRSTMPLSPTVARDRSNHSAGITQAPARTRSSLPYPSPSMCLCHLTHG